MRASMSVRQSLTGLVIALVGSEEEHSVARFGVIFVFFMLVAFIFVFDVLNRRDDSSNKEGHR